MTKNLSPLVKALASADFSATASLFQAAGFSVVQPVSGILQVTCAQRVLRRPRVLLSVGVHGDETAPIELMARLLHELSSTPHALAVDLMIVVGNPAAIAEAKRFVDADLNRLFQKDRGDLAAAREARRADDIMQAAADFFDNTGADKWHLDLHTTIRPSLYPAFAVVPEPVAAIRRNALLGWLRQAGVGAAILNPLPAGTLSAFTSRTFGAASATVELGQVGQLGQNDIDQFADAYRAIDTVLRKGTFTAVDELPDVYSVAQELTKHSSEFRLSFDRNVRNFTSVAPGTTVAKDGQITYRAGDRTEYVVFPNPDVRPGLRAGLMVVRHN